MKILPGPKGLPLFGSMPYMVRNIADFFHITTQRYGPMSTFKMGLQPAILVAEPNNVAEIFKLENTTYNKSLYYENMKTVFGEGLITSNGALWQNQRQLIQPYFTKHKVKRWHPAIGRLTQGFIERLVIFTKTEQPINISKAIATIVHDVAIRIILGRDPTDENCAHITNAITTVNRSLLHHILGAMLCKGAIDKLPTPGNLRFRKALKQLHEALDKQINTASDNSDNDTDSLLTILTGTQKETSCPMSNKQIRDELITFFLAAQDTTVSTLIWIVYNICQYPILATKMQHECQQSIQGTIPTLEELSQLTFTQAFIEESMRLHPAVYAISRTSCEDTVLGDYTIPNNSFILLSPYVMHRHPDYWTSSLVFDPTRFLNKTTHEQQRYTYMPFAGGARLCIGMHLAMLEIKMITAMFMKSFSIASYSPKVLISKPLLTLRPHSDLYLNLKLHHQ